MFSIKADAGMGKSAFAAYMIREMKASGRLAACFFCKFGQKSRSDGESILMSLAYQIALRYPECYAEVMNAAKTIREATPPRSLEDKFKLLLSDPLSLVPRSMGEEKSMMYAILVIVALDEIGVYESEDRKAFLKVLRNKLDSLPKWVKLLVTSRPDLDIVSSFDRINPQLIEADDPNHISDLKTYIRSQLQNHLVCPEADDEAVALLLEKSQGRFIYMSLVAKDKFDGDIKYSLDQLKNNFPDGLDGVYVVNFSRIFSGRLKFIQEKVKPLLQLLVRMLEPLTVHNAQALLKCKNEDMTELISRLGNMFPVVGDDDARKFTVYHKTVLDWLLNAEKSRREGYGNHISSYWWQRFFLFGLETDRKFVEYDYHVDLQQAHGMFSQALLSQIQGYEASSFSSSSTLTFPSLEWQYLYNHLIEHMVKCDRSEEAKILLLHLGWLEMSVRYCPVGVMDVLKDMRQVIEESGSSSSIRGLKESFKLVTQARQTSLATLPNTIDREGRQLELSWWFFLFINSWNALTHYVGGVMIVWRKLRYAIAEGSSSILGLDESLILAAQATQMSLSALSSIVDRKKEGGPATSWSWLLFLLVWLTLYKSQGRVLAMWKHMRFANKERETMQCVDESLRLLSQATQMSLPTLSNIMDRDELWWSFLLNLIGHLRATVSRRQDSMIMLKRMLNKCMQMFKATQHVFPIKYDLEQAGGALQAILYGHSGTVISVCLSSDNKKIISGSWDKTIKIWDAATGVCERTLDGYNSYATAVCISSDNKMIVSGSKDKTIKIWAAATETSKRTFEGHNSSVILVCISSDGKRIISASIDRTIKIWNAATGECERTLEDLRSFVISVCISSDDRHIISGSIYGTTKIWDAATRVCERTVYDHSGPVISVCLSFDNKKIISGSDDNTIKIWDAATGVCERTLDDHSYSVISVCISSDDRHVISGSLDGTKVINIIKKFHIFDGARISHLQVSNDCFAYGTDSGGVQWFALH
jgi:WD40 repeat protein